MKTWITIALLAMTAVSCSPDKSVKAMNFGPGPQEEESIKTLEADCGCSRG